MCLNPNPYIKKTYPQAKNLYNSSTESIFIPLRFLCLLYFGTLRKYLVMVVGLLDQILNPFLVLEKEEEKNSFLVCVQRRHLTDNILILERHF